MAIKTLAAPNSGKPLKPSYKIGKFTFVVKNVMGSHGDFIFLEGKVTPKIDQESIGEIEKFFGGKVRQPTKITNRGDSSYVKLNLTEKGFNFSVDEKTSQEEGQETLVKAKVLSTETTPPWEAKAHGLVLKCLESKKAHLVDSLYLAADPEDDAPEESWAAYEVTNGSVTLTAGQSQVYNDNRMALLAAFCKANQLDMEFMCIKNKLYIAFTSDCELHQLADLM